MSQPAKVGGCKTLSMKLLALLAFVAVVFANALKWQDCGLQSDFPALRLIAYAHEPDPIHAALPSNISKSWWHFGATTLTGLTERVYIDRKLPGAREWTPYFNNTFAVCGTGPFQHEHVCPVAPNATFSYVDQHPRSHSPPAEFRAREEYFDASGAWIGCATIVYESVA